MFSDMENTKRSEEDENCCRKNGENALFKEDREVEDARQVRAEVIIRAHLAVT